MIITALINRIFLGLRWTYRELNVRIALRTLYCNLFEFGIGIWPYLREKTWNLYYFIIVGNVQSELCAICFAIYEFMGYPF